MTAYIEVNLSPQSLQYINNITPFITKIRLYRTNNTNPFDFDITGVDCIAFYNMNKY